MAWVSNPKMQGFQSRPRLFRPLPTLEGIRFDSFWSPLRHVTFRPFLGRRSKGVFNKEGSNNAMIGKGVVFLTWKSWQCGIYRLNLDSNIIIACLRRIPPKQVETEQNQTARKTEKSEKILKVTHTPKN